MAFESIQKMDVSILSPKTRRPERKYPRVSVDVPVEVRTADARVIGRSVNLSIDGILIRSARTFAPETELAVRFNLPDGHSIASLARVVHTTAGATMGLEFLQMQPESRRVLADFTGKMKRYVRRGRRIARRYHLLVRESAMGHKQEEMAETVVVSRHGGLLICRAGFNLGDQIHIWCPEKNRGAEAKVRFWRPVGIDGLVELGFEFRDTENFWDLDFSPDLENQNPSSRPGCHRLQPPSTA